MAINHRLFGMGLFAFALTVVPQISYGSNCLDSGFLPPNRLNIPPNSILNSGMTEAKFNQIIDRVENYYKPIVSGRGGVLKFERSWADGTVNAYANRTGNLWSVKMFGGLARHSAITDDGFTLVACHEMGHHMGGAPKVRGQWAANEGQADYYATLKCLRNIWQGDNNVEIVRGMNVDPVVTRSCEQSFGSAATIALCVRNAMAGLSSANLMRALAGSSPIDFKTPDRAVVSTTFDEHPAAQCRLDTYYNGAICQVNQSEPLSETNPAVGTCAVETGMKVGVRPLCWYKPGTQSPPPTPTPTPPPGGGSIARQPSLAGVTELLDHNPNAMVPVVYDVSEFPGASGVYMEVSAPNREFATPNGVNPDPSHTGGATQRGVRGRFQIIPAKHLPGGWGIYSIRIIPLDKTGQTAVGQFSNSSHLILRPQ